MNDGIRGQLEEIFYKLLSKNTEYNCILKDQEKKNQLKYPRIEFEIIEINENYDILAIDNDYDENTHEIIDNYNIISEYMLDFDFIYKSDKSANIDKLKKILTNKFKLSRYFSSLNYDNYDVKDLVVMSDLKIVNKNQFYADQSISINAYSLNFIVQLYDKDMIPAGIIMKRGV
ncbi:MAG: hypothetical protein RR795_01410 [Cetobacterium sp.]|uniref:hypothetical protein n=1 Tax=Cetobacterium sp. TaxID=2071632 RepID=UPI002FC60BEA